MRGGQEILDRMDAREASGASVQEMEEYQRVLDWMNTAARLGVEVVPKVMDDRITSMGLNALQFTVDQARFGSADLFEQIMRRYVAWVWLLGHDSTFLEDGPDAGDCRKLNVIFGLAADMWGAP